MNRRPTSLPNQTARAALLLIPWIAAAAGGQEPADLTPANLDPAKESRAIAAVAKKLLAHADPVLRGEAALALATASHLDDGLDPFKQILDVSKDPADAASLRGLLALGILAVPGVEIRLEDVLDGARSRPTTAETAAALGLGMLPDDHPGIGVEAYLSRFLASSHSRHEDVLRSLLVGMRGPHPNKVSALQDLIDDDSLKDPGLRQLILEILARSPHGLSAARVTDLLRSSNPAERALAADLVPDLLERQTAAERNQEREAEPPDPLLLRLEVLARRDPAPEVRAAALRALTAARHLPALELAAEAAESEFAVEATQGVISAVRLGGRASSRALERQILDERQPGLQAALLEALPGPWSAAYVAGCRELATDEGVALSVRVRAALVVDRATEDGGPLLRRMFCVAADPADLEHLADAILAGAKDLPELDNLRPEGRPLDSHRLQALIGAGHPKAFALLLERLLDPRANSADKGQLLRAWRHARSTTLSPTQRAQLPRELRELL